MCFMLSSTSVVDFLHATGQLDMTGSNTANLVWKVRRGNTTVVKTTEQVPTAGSFLDGPNVKPLQRAQCRLYWHDT
jgi:hypothetical protein